MLPPSVAHLLRLTSEELKQDDEQGYDDLTQGQPVDVPMQALPLAPGASGLRPEPERDVSPVRPPNQQEFQTPAHPGDDELPPLLPESEDEDAVDPLDQMAGEPEDEDFFEAAEDAQEYVTPRASHDRPVPGTVRALREQFEQAREPRVSTASTISSAALQAGHEVLVLSLKPSFKSQKGRELDPRFFSTAEREQFDKADTANWQKHINLGAVEIVQPEQAERILRTRPQTVLAVRARFVRTAATDESGDYEAKSRIVLPGHLLAKGVQYGHERTDSPTASLTSTYVGLSIVAHFGWELEGFDVEAAFLTGNKMSREVYFKPLKGGLPGLPAGCLLRAVKGLFGVPEAPRLWYLEISETAIKSGWRRVHATPCVFVVTDNAGRVCGILILHVDDGILAGDGSATYQKARKTFLEKLRINKLQKNDIVHLKRRIMRHQTAVSSSTSRTPWRASSRSSCRSSGACRPSRQ